MSLYVSVNEKKAQGMRVCVLVLMLFNNDLSVSCETRSRFQSREEEHQQHAGRLVCVAVCCSAQLGLPNMNFHCSERITLLAELQF